MRRSMILRILSFCRQSGSVCCEGRPLLARILILQWEQRSSTTHVGLRHLDRDVFEQLQSAQTLLLHPLLIIDVLYPLDHFDTGFAVELGGIVHRSRRRFRVSDGFDGHAWLLYASTDGVEGSGAGYRWDSLEKMGRLISCAVAERSTPWGLQVEVSARKPDGPPSPGTNRAGSGSGPMPYRMSRWIATPGRPSWATIPTG